MSWNWTPHPFTRVQDAASDHIDARYGVTLDCHEDLGAHGYCLDAPSFIPAGGCIARAWDRQQFVRRPWAGD